MCIICRDKKTAFKDIRFLQDRLARLNNLLKQVILEHIKPHTEEYKEIILCERTIVRMLIDEVL